MGRRQDKRNAFAVEYRWRPEEFSEGFRSFFSSEWRVWRRYATEQARDAALRTLVGKEARDRYPTREFRAG